MALLPYAKRVANQRTTRPPRDGRPPRSDDAAPTLATAPDRPPPTTPRPTPTRSMPPSTTGTDGED